MSPDPPGEVAFNRHPQLEKHFTVHRIQWTVIDEPGHARLDAEWNLVYGKVFCGQRYRHGVKAEAELANRTVRRFLFVPFLGARGGPHSIAKRRLTAAYDCAGDLVPLGQFCAIDFFIAPPSLDWTMIHTHEDHALGGPYFIDRNWLVQLPELDRRASRRRGH